LLGLFFGKNFFSKNAISKSNSSYEKIGFALLFILSLFFPCGPGDNICASLFLSKKYLISSPVFFPALFSYLGNVTLILLSKSTRPGCRGLRFRCWISCRAGTFPTFVRTLERTRWFQRADSRSRRFSNAKIAVLEKFRNHDFLQKNSESEVYFFAKPFFEISCYF